MMSLFQVFAHLHKAGINVVRSLGCSGSQMNSGMVNYVKLKYIILVIPSECCNKNTTHSTTKRIV